jgi:hypothetical protein
LLKKEKLETVFAQNKQVVMETVIKLLVIQNKVAVGQTLETWNGDVNKNLQKNFKFASQPSKNETINDINNTSTIIRTV